MTGPDPVLTVILPTFNEAEALPTVLGDIAACLDVPHEVIVVDDGSSDGSGEIARQLGATVIIHDRNRGKGAAMMTGATAARADRLVFMDADGTYPASQITRLAGLLDSHSVSRGIRSIDDANTPRLNRWGNALFDRLLGSFHRLEGTDHLSGLYAIRRADFLAMQIESRGFDVEVEIGIKSRMMGLEVACHPIEYRPRIGDKKLRPLSDGWRILTRVTGMLVLFSPVATFVVPGIVLAGSGAVLGVVLWNGPVSVASLGLSFHSFIVAALGLVGGIQLVVIGTAAALYRTEAGFPARTWLVGLSRRPIRAGLSFVGLILAVGGLVGTAGRVLSWVLAGGGPFTDTIPLVGWATLGIVGLELLSAGLFLSIFGGRLRD